MHGNVLTKEEAADKGRLLYRHLGSGTGPQHDVLREVIVSHAALHDCLAISGEAMNIVGRAMQEGRLVFGEEGFTVEETLLLSTVDLRAAMAAGLTFDEIEEQGLDRLPEIGGE